MSQSNVYSAQFTLTGNEDNPFSGLSGTEIVIVKALSSNVAPVAIGDPGLTVNNSFVLDPGESIAVNLLNAPAIKAKGTVNDKICIFATQP